MNSRLFFAIFLGAFCLTHLAEAQDEPGITSADLEAFKALYQEEIVRVERSRSTQDDRALAKTMLEFAENIPDDPGVRMLIYIEVVALSASGGDLKSMVVAADALKLLWPGHQAVQTMNLVELAERAYRVTARKDRQSVGDIYIDLLIKQSKEYEQEGDYKQALSICRKAEVVARAVNSSKRRNFEVVSKRIVNLYDVEKKISQLVNTLDRNPQNKPAASELAELFIVKKNDRQSARRYAELAGDKELLEILTICDGDVNKVPAMDALRAGDWYYDLAVGKDGEDAELLLTHARQWYARFFDKYNKKDVLANKVASRDEVADIRLKKIGIQKDEESKSDWVDLAKKYFNPQKHILAGKVEIDENQLSVNFGNFVIPTMPQSDYELRIRLTVKGGDPDIASIIAYLPIGDQGALVRYWWSGTQGVVVDGANAKAKLKDRGQSLDKEIVLLYQVAATGGDNVLFGLVEDGNQIVKWKGPVGKLKPIDPGKLFTPPKEMGNVFRIICPSGEVIIHKIELRQRQG